MTMTDRQQLALLCLRAASADEWIGADQVASRMREAGDEKASSTGVGRILSKLADEGHCLKRHTGAQWSFRAPLRAVVVYDVEGVEAGRILLWSTRTGLEVDLSQLADVLVHDPGRLAKAAGDEWRFELAERDVRTVRAACDEALFR